MAVIRGGAKKDWKDNHKGKNKKYQQHLREIVRQGKGFRANGDIADGKEVAGAMHDHCYYGYHFSK
jgi:hypothetical protein